jgi:uncharacterized protein YceH (UPF0502 family)
MELTAEQVRILGCLAEKEATVPDSYPLTVNALVTACNQTSNRNPVVSYDERLVSDTLVGLREQGLTRIVYSERNRAPKHRHVLHEVLHLDPPELAILSVLMLRGPQTVGELRTRTERHHPFESLGEVEATLERLAARADEPLVVRLERQPGQKEARWAHLLSGEVVDVPAAPPPVERSAGGCERRAAVEEQVAELRAALDEVRRELGLPTAFD